jgi:hypothetical protein
MSLGVNFPELSRNIELFFKEKICELSSRDGEPGGASVHDGLVAVASREAHRSVARRHCRAQELAVGWGKGEELRGSSRVAIWSDGTARWTGQRRTRAAAGDAHRGRCSGEEELGKRWGWMRGSVRPGSLRFIAADDEARGQRRRPVGG